MKTLRTKKKIMKVSVILLLALIIVGALVITAAMKPANVELSKQNANVNKLEASSVGDFTIAVDAEMKNSTIVGDVNLDGYVTNYDAILIQGHNVGKPITDEHALSNADVDGDGNITAGDSACILKFSTESKSEIGKITVPLYNPLNKDRTIQLKALNKSGEVETGVTWKSTNTSVATVDKDNGLVKVIGKGKTEITATKDGKQDKFYIEGIEEQNANNLAIAVDEEMENSTIVGDVNCDGYVTLYDGVLILKSTVDKYVISEQGLKNADVDNDNSVLAGDASEILKHLEGKVTNITRPLYNPLAKGKTIKLKVFNASGSSPTEVTEVSWRSTNESVASVDSSGQVTIKGVGHTQIIATKDENSDVFCIEGVNQDKIQLSYTPNNLLTSLPIRKDAATWLNNKYIYIYDEEGQYEQGYDYKITLYEGNENNGIFQIDDWNSAEKVSNSGGDFYRIEMPGHGDDVYIDGTYGIQVRRKGLEETESETYYHKLDTKAPVITGISWKTTANSITVELEETDALSGIKTNKIALGMADEDEYIDTYEDEMNTCTFENLTPNGFYCLSEIKVEDNAGNTYKITQDDYTRLEINSLDIYTKPEAPEVCRNVNGENKFSRTSINNISTESEEAILYFIGGVKGGNYYKVEYEGESNSTDYYLALEDMIYIENKAGTHTLKVKANGNGGDSEEAVYQIKFVSPSEPQVTITLDKKNITLKKGDTQQLVATVNPSSSNVTWSSNKTSVATVDQTGKVTAVAEGTATITAAVGDVKATCTVTVTEEDPDVEYVPLDSIKLSSSSISLKVGETNSLQLTLIPTTADIETITWTSSKESVATVDNNGKITAVAEGTATITVTVTDKSGNTKTATVNVTVTKENNNGGNGNGSGNNGGQTNGAGNNGGNNGGSTLSDVLGSGTKNDPTLAEKVIPKTGFTHILLIATGIIAAGGIFAFIRYKKILK